MGAVLLAAALLAPARTGAQDGGLDGPTAGLDQVLDLYVRDGDVYYATLRSDRARLDRYVSAIGATAVDSMSRDAQVAFWLNAYNALVLRTVVDNYPIRQRSKDYPPRSIRQIPGAFERVQHRVAGRLMTLDQIEQTVLPGFGDPRVYLALGRGAVGSGRLRSEAYHPTSIDRQLGAIARECVTRAQCVNIDRVANRVLASSIFSWREREFTAAYADKAPRMFGDRSPIERAVLALVQPNLLQIERDFVDLNNFELRYQPFDWSLNDLTGGR
jgi:hypothetical protein